MCSRVVIFDANASHPGKEVRRKAFENVNSMLVKTKRQMELRLKKSEVEARHPNVELIELVYIVTLLVSAQLLHAFQDDPATIFNIEISSMKSRSKVMFVSRGSKETISHCRDL